MKSVSALLAALLLFGTSRVRGDGVPPAEIFSNLEAGRKQTVVIYGTSLSHGGQWAEEVRRWFEAQYPGLVAFHNSSGSGKNSDWGLANLAAGVLRHRPHLVFVEFSYNDCVDRFEMPVERGASNLGQMVDKILGQDPKTTVVLQVMNVAWDAPNGRQSGSIRSRLESFNDNYRALARAQRLPLLDHYPNWLRLQREDPGRFRQLVPDGSHPTAEGSRMVTWPTVRNWLEQSRAATVAGREGAASSAR